MTTKISIADQKYATAYWANNIPGAGSTFESWWPLTTEGKRYFSVLPSDLPLTIVNNALNWLNYVFYVIPILYVGFGVFRKPRYLRDKYRISIFPVAVVAVFYGLSIISFAMFASTSSLGDSWNNFFDRSIDASSGAKTDFAAFWSLVSSDYSSQMNTGKALAIVSLCLIGISILYSILLLILNPRVDRDKIQHASVEFQKATASLLQGQVYEMDPSLYDNETLDTTPSKFQNWMKSIFSPRKKD